MPETVETKPVPFGQPWASQRERKLCASATSLAPLYACGFFLHGEKPCSFPSFTITACPPPQAANSGNGSTHTPTATTRQNGWKRSIGWPPGAVRLRRQATNAGPASQNGSGSANATRPTSGVVRNFNGGPSPRMIGSIAS